MKRLDAKRTTTEICEALGVSRAFLWFATKAGIIHPERQKHEGRWHFFYSVDDFNTIKKMISKNE
jgi:predicted transcriptional regulator